MSDILKDRNELLEAVKAPDRRKKQPINFVLIFKNFYGPLVKRSNP